MRELGHYQLHLRPVRIPLGMFDMVSFHNHLLLHVLESLINCIKFIYLFKSSVQVIKEPKQEDDKWRNQIADCNKFLCRVLPPHYLAIILQ